MTAETLHDTDAVVPKPGLFERVIFGIVDAKIRFDRPHFEYLKALTVDSTVTDISTQPHSTSAIEVTQTEERA